jgi:hypothetical protein
LLVLTDERGSDPNSARKTDPAARQSSSGGAARDEEEDGEGRVLGAREEFVGCGLACLAGACLVVEAGCALEAGTGSVRQRGWLHSPRGGFCYYDSFIMDFEKVPSLLL